MRRALALPPHVAVARTLRFLTRAGNRRIGSAAQYWRCPYERRPRALALPALLLQEQDFSRFRAILAADAERSCSHVFDILNSGDHVWNATSSARLAPGSRAYATKLNAHLSPGYHPIDWALDPPSGYRWPADKAAIFALPAPRPGVEIKRPWDLSRLHHLPRLALAACFDPDRRDILRRELFDQFLDFRAANPPGFGVTWACPMDVALRAVNLIVTAAILDGAGLMTQPDAAAVRAMVREHGRYVAAHLEWAPDIRGNHYFADLLGLIFCGVACDDAEGDAWLAFAASEFFAEARTQQNPDGSNFEASTFYHRMVGEMLAWGTIALGGLSQERLTRLRSVAAGDMPRPAARLTAEFWPRDWFIRLDMAAAFTKAVTQPNGTVPQIGDCDDGRVIALDPTTPNSDHSGLIDLLSVAAGRTLQSPSSLEAAVAQAWPQSQHRPRLTEDNAERARLCAFNDFGLFVFRRADYHLTFRCGTLGQGGNGGHAHNDQLAITLCIGETPVFIDPGTGNYTANPEQRNLFRSTAMHNTLSMDDLEQNAWTPGLNGLFSLKERSFGHVIAISEDKVEAEHVGFGPSHKRAIRFGDDLIEGTDCCDAPGRKTLRFHLAPGLTCHIYSSEAILEGERLTVHLRAQAGHWDLRPSLRSDRYGQVAENLCLVFEMDEPEANWSLRWRKP